MGKDGKHMIHSLGSSVSYGMLSWQAKILWPMMIPEMDDQGRFDARPKVVKWEICQNADEIERDDIPKLFKEMIDEGMLVLYGPDLRYGQMVNWWDRQPMNYARPSEYPPPDGWQDRIRYHNGTEMVSMGWESPGGFPDGWPNDTPSVPPNDTPKDGGQLNLTKPNLTKPKSSQPRKRGNPESRKKLKHWAFKIWRDVFGKKVKGKPPDIDQRDAIIAFAESKGEEWWHKRLEYWKQHPWSPWNFKGMMETKWEPSDAKDKRGHKRGQDTETLPYDDFAAAQQEATRLHAGEVGDGGSSAK